MTDRNILKYCIEPNRTCQTVQQNTEYCCIPRGKVFLLSLFCVCGVVGLWVGVARHPCRLGAQAKGSKEFFLPAAWISAVPLSSEKTCRGKTAWDNRTLIHQAQLHGFANPSPPPPLLCSQHYVVFFSSHLISFEGLGQNPVVDVVGHAGEGAVDHFVGAPLCDAFGDGLGVAAVGEREKLPVAHPAHLLDGTAKRAGCENQKGLTRSGVCTSPISD